MNVVKPGYFGYDYTDAKRDQFDQRNEYLLANNTQVDILFYGDSITEAFLITAYEYLGTVVNSGIGGDRTVYMRKRFEADALQLNPNKVILLGGINDVQAWLRGEEYVGYDADGIVAEVTANIIEMADMVLGAGNQVLVASVLPIKRPPEKLIDNELAAVIIRRINSVLRDYTEVSGADFVDYYSAFVDRPSGMLIESYASDGLHPNETGYKIMIDILNKHI
ncbi:SGNH/GDSL hydrolase family protein [Culicoidibacter larvae]|uniref:SGNH hydrolase-type esterase domain-containing protein n=1 Tax=Culicoidibacter larvae TaxID=2579976 RepID=A0A5R8QHA9_9FIRM|nr:GDSL-type esterase/lipase family protein [Culicoidibacter larvae]TLG77126.1 hypothetical protein FEZ08_00475 [Culicoidibacter larvae]